MRNVYLTTALSAVMLFSAPAYASSLTSTQISSIVSLLQSFNVTQQTIASVETALGATISPVPTGVTFTGTPTSGSAPLTVAFNASGLSGGTPYIINYGDGQNSGSLNTIEPPCAFGSTSQCGPMINATHTYASAGTYTATLSLYIGCLYTNPHCEIAVQSLGSVVVNVQGSGVSQPTLSTLTPNTGTVGSEVTVTGSGFTSDNTILFDGMVAARDVVMSGSQTLQFSVPSTIGANCSLSVICTDDVGLVTPGTYNVAVENANGTSNTATFTVTGSNTGSLSITGLDAPSQLAVGQTGTWTVHVANATGQISYSVVWGDEQNTLTPTAAGVSTNVSTSGTFTHSYMNTGTYTPVFMVSGANGSAKTSATVVVGGSPFPPPVPPPCIEMNGNLGIGSTGSGVAQLQQSLGVTSTGYFGALTQAAIMKWQTVHSVPATGYVGPLTRAAFIIGCGNPIPPVVTGSQPTVYGVNPTSGSVGTTVSVTGFGFTSDNTILMDGSLAARDVPITSSVAITCTTSPTCKGGIRQTLQFTIPSTLGPNCPVGSECPTYLREVTPGQYDVSVQNTNGTSNTSSFTVVSSTSL
jgi:peptidoglycan hydrolase-like protein with peptidoglycan-binding domain